MFATAAAEQVVKPSQSKPSQCNSKSYQTIKYFFINNRCELFESTSDQQNFIRLIQFLKRVYGFVLPFVSPKMYEGVREIRNVFAERMLEAPHNLDFLPHNLSIFFFCMFSLFSFFFSSFLSIRFDYVTILVFNFSSIVDVFHIKLSCINVPNTITRYKRAKHF